jgi:hypothetical protein
MAAAATFRQTKSHTRSTNVKGNSEESGEPVSFHLAFILGNDFALPEGTNSVEVLRTPFAVHSDGRPPKENLTGTKMEFWTKKFNRASVPLYVTAEQEVAWQDRLLVITDKRIFICTEKHIVKDGGKHQKSRPTALHANNERAKDSNSSVASMEIVDSIPLEEITSVSIDMDSTPGVWTNEMLHGGKHANPQLELQETEKSLLRFRPKSAERDGLCEPILRILTKPNEFNRGEPYYFLLRQQQCPCVDGDGSPVPLKSRADATLLADRLAALAKRRHTEHARENRFLRLQKRLRQWWNSVPFNLLVLALIVSNFAFTVLQLENQDSDMQTFYENVDLAYTIIFTIGAPPPRDHARQERAHGGAHDGAHGGALSRTLDARRWRAHGRARDRNGSGGEARRAVRARTDKFTAIPATTPQQPRNIPAATVPYPASPQYPAIPPSPAITPQ